MLHQAQDTFTGLMEDGTGFTVVKGQYLPEGHELVKRDQDGAGVLFKPADFGEDEKPPAKSDPKPAAAKAAPVKPAGKASS